MVPLYRLEPDPEQGPEPEQGPVDPALRFITRENE